jgi:hypothetical protein
MMKTTSEIEALYTRNMGTNHSAALTAVYQAGAADARAEQAPKPQAPKPLKFEHAPIAPDPLAHLRASLKAKSPVKQ